MATDPDTDYLPYSVKSEAWRVQHIKNYQRLIRICWNASNLETAVFILLNDYYTTAYEGTIENTEGVLLQIEMMLNP